MYSSVWRCSFGTEEIMSQMGMVLRWKLSVWLSFISHKRHHHHLIRCFILYVWRQMISCCVLCCTFNVERIVPCGVGNIFYFPRKYKFFIRACRQSISQSFGWILSWWLYLIKLYIEVRLNEVDIQIYLIFLYLSLHVWLHSHLVQGRISSGVDFVLYAILWN